MTHAFVATCQGQQPFVTDDADVTPKSHFHFEFNNQFNVLRSSAYPFLKQNTTDAELNYGILENVEIGIQVPFATLFAARDTAPGTVNGMGDINLSAKYNFLRERDNSKWPALTITVIVELPTGAVSKQIGSGLLDIHLNGVMQKSLTERSTFRLNGGVLYSGYKTTGIQRIKSRGVVVTGSGSLTKKMTEKLLMGVEVVGAVTNTFALGKGQLLTQLGGNYRFAQRATFDFGLLAGKYTASPRVGLQLGVSIDF